MMAGRKNDTRAFAAAEPLRMRITRISAIAGPVKGEAKSGDPEVFRCYRPRSMFAPPLSPPSPR